MTNAVFNYTGRIDLFDTDVTAEYFQKDAVISLKIKWNLVSYDFDSDCDVAVDLKVLGTFEFFRLELGTVGDGVGEKVFDLPQISNPELMRLRFKVTQKDEKGLLLMRGELATIVPKNPEEQGISKSILKIVKQDDLQAPWRLGLEEGEPILYISGKADLYYRLRGSAPLFDPLVLPELVRQIFIWIAFIEVDENNIIHATWRELFEELGAPVGFISESRSVNDEGAVDEVHSIAREISERFANLHKIIDGIVKDLENEDRNG